MERERVAIHYRRPPDRLQIFEQEVVHRTPEVTVTFLPRAGVKRPVVVEGGVILEPESPVVWFTYPDEWHDVGRFHLASGELTGYYANLLTPVVMDGARWETTDLFLDVWAPVRGEPQLLDEDELADAVRMGWVDGATAARAREHAAALLRAAREGSWPPTHVHEWTLERARGAAGSG